MSQLTPTVIVARQVRPGEERAFERWNARLLAAAERAPGHQGSEVQPPGPAHPQEWVTVYRFASVEALDAWLVSPQRQALLEEGAALLAGPVREQRIVEPAAGADVVTGVMTQRVRPDAAADFRRFHGELTLLMAGFDGFIRSDLVEPVEDVQDEHVIVFSFASKDALDRWLGSEERREKLAELAPLIEGERTLNVVGGFAGWFPAPGERAPVRWKQAVAVLIALFPTTLTLGTLQRWLVPDVPWVPALFVSNVLGIAILTWLLMPPLTRALSGWLRR